MLNSALHFARLIPNRAVERLRPYSKTVQETQAYKDRVNKLIRFNKDTKDLLGPLIKNKIVPKKNKTDKNSSSSIIGASTREPSPVYGNATVCSLVRDRGMWNKSRSGQLGLRIANVCGFKTVSRSNAAQNPSAAEPGFASEDKILQIKPHRNDYSREYPSVTLILNKTMSEESRAALEKWRQEKIAEMGEEEFKRHFEASLAVATKFHSTLKRYFTLPRHKLGIDTDVEPVWNSVSHLLKSISAPKAIESNVVHPVLKYRGIFDAIANYEEKPMLIEWKKSEKPRKAISLTYDNPIQLAAYFGAVSNDLNYKHMNVRDALLVIAYTDGSKADHFHLPIDKLREHWAHWLTRLENYTKNHASDSEKILKGGKRLFEEDIGNLQ